MVFDGRQRPTGKLCKGCLQLSHCSAMIVTAIVSGLITKHVEKHTVNGVSLRPHIEISKEYSF